MKLLKKTVAVFAVMSFAFAGFAAGSSSKKSGNYQGGGRGQSQRGYDEYDSYGEYDDYGDEGYDDYDQGYGNQGGRGNGGYGNGGYGNSNGGRGGNQGYGNQGGRGQGQRGYDEYDDYGDEGYDDYDQGYGNQGGRGNGGYGNGGYGNGNGGRGGNQGYGNQGGRGQGQRGYDNYDDYDQDYDRGGNQNYGGQRGNRGNNSGSNTGKLENYNDTSTWSDTSYASSKKGSLFGKIGSATSIKDKTVIVSIFANDNNTNWNGADLKKKNCLKYLKIATDWLVKGCKKYGVSTSFVYDWSKDADLVKSVTLKSDLTQESDDMDLPGWKYIEARVDSEALMKKYGAKNMIYLILVNTPSSSTITSCTSSAYDGVEYPYEICYMYQGCDGDSEEPPAAYAHEILHTFGAPDLYTADTDGYNYNISQKFVSYCESNNVNDIMFTTFDSRTGKAVYDKITNDFTDLDAYYIGIKDTCPELSKWGFFKSQYDN